MALTSFVLRNTIANGGSALRRTNVNQDGSNPSGSGAVVSDSGLKADGFFVPVPPEYLESTFSANVFERGAIELEWRLGTALVSSPATADFEPVEIVIRASEYGEPVTVGDGIFVVSTTAANYIETYTDVAGPSRPYIGEGRWAYYSMFIKYQDSNGDAFYEKVAVVSVQTPYDFGSTALLWDRIPLYYRQLDDKFVDEVSTYTESRGPLYRFVDLFGWELDKMRTTIYDTSRISDPDVVHSSAIDALAKQTGIEFTKDALGTGKLRSILTNIGYLRRSKGTPNSVASYISALSGCGVTAYLYQGIRRFDVHPMRVNLLSDPLFAQAITNTDTDSVGSAEFHRVWTALGPPAHGWGVRIGYSSGATAPTVTTSNGTLTVSVAPGGPDANYEVIFYGRKSFTYNNNLVYYGSADCSRTFNLRFFRASDLSSIEDTTPAPFSTFDSWNNFPVPSFPVFAHPTRHVTGSIPSPTPVSPEDVLPVFIFNLPYTTAGGATLTITEPMVEYRNYSGEFFTGNTAGGGFLPDSTGAVNEGIYDYHWGQNAAGTPHTDFSYYTIDFYRSKKVTENIVQNYVMPVDQTALIYWDWLE